MQHLMWLALTLLLLVTALAGLVIAWRLRPKPALCQPQQYDATPQPGTFAVRALEAMPPIVRDTPVLEAQAPAWREAMAQAGLRLRRAGVRHGARVPRDGFSYLVDYGDRGTGALPNCLATCFGHGVYTSYGAMLFNSRLLADPFYR